MRNQLSASCYYAKRVVWPKVG